MSCEKYNDGNSNRMSGCGGYIKDQCIWSHKSSLNRDGKEKKAQNKLKHGGVFLTEMIP
jgi:hypothetical protein